MGFTLSPQIKYMVYYILTYILHHLRVYYKITMRPAPSWLDSSACIALHRYRRGHTLVRIPLKPEFFPGLISLRCVKLWWPIMSSHISLICSSNILHIFPFSDFLFYMVQPQRLSRSQDLSLFPTYTNDLRTSRLLLLIDRLSMTFTANGKNETFVVSLQLCVQ